MAPSNLLTGPKNFFAGNWSRADKIVVPADYVRQAKFIAVGQESDVGRFRLSPSQGGTKDILLCVDKPLIGEIGSLFGEGSELTFDTNDKEFWDDTSANKSEVVGGTEVAYRKTYRAQVIIYPYIPPWFGTKRDARAECASDVYTTGAASFLTGQARVLAMIPCHHRQSVSIFLNNGMAQSLSWSVQALTWRQGLLAAADTIPMVTQLDPYPGDSHVPTNTLLADQSDTRVFKDLGNAKFLLVWGSVAANDDYANVAVNWEVRD